MAKMPCFLCSKELELRRDKHKKPYFVCDSCGVQIFVRGSDTAEMQPICCPCGCGKQMDRNTGLYFPDRAFYAMGYRCTSGPWTIWKQRS